MNGAPREPHDERQPSAVDVRRATDRATTRTDWLTSRHSFAFGAHYDPANTHHGPLVAHNHDTVAAGTGFDEHPHRDTEIVTWVLEGSLVHEDSTGRWGVVHPGLAQRMSAGSGIRHSERNDTWRDDTGRLHEPTRPVEYVQMWVAPSEPGLVPAHEQREVDEAMLVDALVPVASGLRQHRDVAAVRINAEAAFHVSRLRPGRSVVLPEAAYLHLFVARGEAVLEGAGQLGRGDAVRLIAGGQRVTATTAAELLVWEMHGTPAR